MEKEFWNERWANKETKWDVGAVSTPLKAYFDQLTDRNQRILIPGCGNGYEAEYLYEQGFKEVYIVEIAAEAIASFKARYPNFPDTHIFNQDFFELEGSYDLIIEQTFFCAIDPKLRRAYAEKMHDLLIDGGKLVGLLFDVPFDGGPPFGGTSREYKGYFEPYFSILKMERAYNSIKPRQERELFILFQK